MDYLRLEPDVGVSAGRNALLRQVKTPYFLLLEDDFEFTAETRVERLASLVADGTVDLAAGDCVRCKHRLFYLRRKPERYHGLLDIRDRHLRMHSGYRSCASGCYTCDIVINFFLRAPNRSSPSAPGTRSLKLSEHEEFFVRMKRHGLRVGFCPEVRIQHWHSRPAGYMRYRDRDFGLLAARKMDVDRFTDIFGKTLVYPRKAA